MNKNYPIYYAGFDPGSGKAALQVIPTDGIDLSTDILTIDTNLRSKVQYCTHADARSAATARQVEIAHVNATWYQRLCEKRPFAFKQSKEKWLYRPKETTLHTASQ